jgi:hypothetical protein
MAAYQEVLRRWGIPATKNLINLMTKAINQFWGTQLFISHLRHTPEYRMKFPGIKFGDATRTEAAYNAAYVQYRQAATSVGERLDRKTFAKMLKRGTTVQEFTTRVEAIHSIEANSALMNAFRETLAANGLAKKAENISKGDLVKFVSRLGDPRWEKLWQETIVPMQVERIAGLQVGDPPKGWAATEGLSITRNDLLTVINQVESLTPGFEVENITGQQWRDIGARLRQFKPSYLAAQGVTAKDLLEMELGGPRAAAIAERGDRILKQQEAFFQARALPTTTPVASGQTAASDLPQTG